MSKRKKLPGAILLVLITAVVTFFITDFFSIVLPGGSVIISRRDFEQYREVAKLLAIKDILMQNYVDKVKPEVLMDGAYKGMASALNDPYTVYMTPAEFKEFMEQTAGSYAGIGIVVSADKEGNLVVVSPIDKDTPGAKAGLKTNDKILEVNGHKVSGKDMDKAVSLMKGPAGTYVTITVLKAGQTKPVTIKIKRETITLKTVRGEMLQDKIGYLRMSMFDEHTYDQFKSELDKLNAQGMKALILDLRDNPGGLLEISVKIADTLLPKGVIVYTEDRYGNKEYKYSDAKYLGKPLAVLVNEGSASASEILTGAIKDHKAGTIIGTKTFGKGIVQTMQEFSDGSALKYTVSRYYTPNGVNIQGKGIMPDITVELPKGFNSITVPRDKDTQLKKAIDVLESQINKK
ncbi:C-terminal processing peptidase-3. Serine peptidase. MEROPS family S41A [Caldanaerobius fijiensis DSM 17918]|uniref:C-terminal processing peptidase-3. Serine peptidase. MEROPS family S41A n=1 Tax=Caldanaerobius fijiensis DSM 17918 TaxID=1121256 RepID=A0A1M5DF07_9THEO|nr:S41 family peptidase [Caldanaerobius fijiensis]SHF65471.1 C-terminal processing peptidase-3. Serine peptidase. MEROPS family S41A [Caldanaerobius fijiensis DSM 17918]